MNFSQGIPEQKFNVNRACFPKAKHQNSQKWAKFMNFSFLALSLVWFAGATPETRSFARILQIWPLQGAPPGEGRNRLKNLECAY